MFYFLNFLPQTQLELLVLLLVVVQVVVVQGGGASSSTLGVKVGRDALNAAAAVAASSAPSPATTAPLVDSALNLFILSLICSQIYLFLLQNLLS